MTTTTETQRWGIDAAIVDAAIAKGRRERSAAFWSFLAALAGRRQPGHQVSHDVDPGAIAAR